MVAICSERDFLSENGWSGSDLLRRAEAIELLKRCTGWHLYILWAATTETVFPFYVGIGRNRRALRHQNPSARAENPIKRSVWERCIAAGGEILYSFPSTDLSQDEAKAAEVALIAKLGRRMKGNGPLANLTDGGEGVIGVVHRKGGASPKAKCIVAEGQEFPSIHEAAPALGLTKSCILNRLRGGWPGYHYPGVAPPPCRKGRRRGAESPVSRAVFVAGVRYETLTAAARALDVRPPAVLRRIKRGWPGYFYESEGQRPLAAPHRKYPVTIDGREYPDMCAAAAATGIPRPTIRCRILARAPGYECENPAYG